ncbi:YlmC/YmxH family sporulation protein [Oceanobacillus alkalisoli]|uniref:YlmC/YmxH family sporulation protein n=1 Tax=Oceanobacillus alkalisoli TaxID=2925113 RepID=UPI001EF0AF09|nr:YlmC/YmxH family sporulation protein [Oceanobacillus alkalisoli]MCF3942510.1 YlmC/YmxH family sporulation protein [Oceanobacillus alkalisoli]MCG5103567.1 YlmC/YmxH family sporulation protein [Oceanobacillus alkalisoli]
MIRLSELQMKEVISVVDGRRLGFIIDLEIDVRTGRIISLILADRDTKGGFFGKAEEIQVLWKQILRIGTDVILVKESADQRTLMLP